MPISSRTRALIDKIRALLKPRKKEMSSEVTVGFYVPLVPKEDTIEPLSTFLSEALSLAQKEPETAQWFALKFAPQETTEGSKPPTFAVFDTFTTELGREAHIKGKIAEALTKNGPELLSEGPQIDKINILASKVKPSGAIGSKTGGLACGLKVDIVAKPDKIDDLRKFLIGALPIVEAEPDTLVWYAIEYPETNGAFAIIDAFPSEEGREAHLNGKVAAALFGEGKELLVGNPDVRTFDVLAAKV